MQVFTTVHTQSYRNADMYIIIHIEAITDTDICITMDINILIHEYIFSYVYAYTYVW